MRGGAQAHLVEADDGRYYVVKAVNNPQHRRILPNEWMASAILRHLDILAPETRVIELTAEFLEANPGVCLEVGSKRTPVTAGWHFASAFPGSPTTQIIYDIVPEMVMPKVFNRQHFWGALAFDKWVGNADSRQAIFFRAKVREWMTTSEEHELKLAFLAQMIDHGYIFNGPHWEFADSPIQGLFFRSSAYAGVKSMADFEPWVERIRNFPPEVLDEALREMPAEWLPEGDAGRLEQLLEQLLRRRGRVADLVLEAVENRQGPFPDWERRGATSA